MRGIRYAEKLKIQAVKQITKGGYKIKDVAERLGITPNSLYNWSNNFGCLKVFPLYHDLKFKSLIKKLINKTAQRINIKH